MRKYNTLGDRIKKRRQALNLKQSDLARLLNCTQAALSQYENGNREPGLNDLSSIARCLNTTTDYLLGLTDISAVDSDIRNMGDYLGLTEESIGKLHLLYIQDKERCREQAIRAEVEFLSGRAPGEDDYEICYNFIRDSAYQDLHDYMKVLNDFIYSEAFSVFISRMKSNLYIERRVYDILKIATKQYAAIESPALSENLAETAYSLVEDESNGLHRYLLNLFETQNAIMDFCRDITDLEELKTLDYQESFLRKIQFFLYSSTKPMFENNNYSVQSMEEKTAELFKPFLSRINVILAKKQEIPIYES